MARPPRKFQFHQVVAHSPELTGADDLPIRGYSRVDQRRTRVPDKHRWWQRGIVYQVYPRSFQDSNRDGVGDLKGIAARLDYLVELGVDAVWVSPIFPSPMADFGYDVSRLHRYRSAVRHARRLRRAGRGGACARPEGHARLRAEPHLRPASLVHREPFLAHKPKRDWYIWRDAKPDGSVPNNWLSEFGGSAWTFDAADRAILLSRVPQAAARPQLAQPRSARRDARRAAVLARPRRRRFSRRRDPSPDRGRASARQSAESGLAGRAIAGAASRAALFARPGGDAWRDRRDARARRRLRGSRADRRSLAADRPADGLLRRRRAGLPPAVQLPPDQVAVGSEDHRRR